MDRELTVTLSAWIDARDTMARRRVSQTEMLAGLVHYASQLEQLIPSLNLAEWEALCELSSSVLGAKRMRADAFRR